MSTAELRTRGWCFILRCGHTEIAGARAPVLGERRWCARHGLQQVVYVRQVTL